jgi:hypothetical protein
LPKTAKPKAQQTTPNPPQNWPRAGAWNYGTVSVSNVVPTWATVSPNIQWQGTTSGATYAAASSVLTT